jgi:hypothetical protein
MNAVRNGIWVVLALTLPLGMTASAQGALKAPSGPRPQMQCDRACLEGFVDKYLAALVAHDPSRLPLTEDIKFTENTVRLNLGQALWKTVTGLGDFKIYLADPYSSQAAFMGVIMEEGKPKLLAARLQIKNGKIREIETIVTRKGLGGDFPATLPKRKAKPIWAEILKPSERVSRADLVHAANQYFEGMELDNGSIVPFADDCNRTENGLQTTNNPDLKPPPGSGGGVDFGSMGCKQQFNGAGVGIFETPERRLWLVDEERGIVLGLFTFGIKGGLIAIPIAEGFKIKSGQIHEIEAIGISDALPFGSSTGW